MRKKLGSVVFLSFAALQLNDPDPVLWVAVYVLPVGIIWFFKELVISAALAVGYAIAAPITLLLAPAHQHPTEPLFEAGGLLLVAVWLAYSWRVGNRNLM